MFHPKKLNRILVVEDDLDVQTVIRLSLEKVGGYTVETCSSGMDAVRKVPEFLPDMVIMDVMMGVMDGPATLKMMRESCLAVDVPVVFLTANIQASKIEEFKQLGVADVIGKPFDPIQLPRKINEIWRSFTAIDSINESIGILRMEFERRLPDRIGEIGSLCDDLICNSQDMEDLRFLFRKIHNLEGASFTFGFDSLGKACRSFAVYVEKSIEAGRLPDNHSANIMDFADILASEIAEATAKTAEPERTYIPVAGNIPETSDVFLTPNDEKRLIYLVEDEEDVARLIVLQMECFGYVVKPFPRIESFREALKKITPSAIIMDVVLFEGDRAGIETIAELRQTLRGKVPVIFLTSRTDFTSRLSSVRARAKAYLTKPVDINLLVANIDALLNAKAPEKEPYRVLMVEDDAAQAECHAAILKKAGMLTKIVTKSADILNCLADFNPDLILMDLYLRDCNGFELAILIRQYESYVGVPVVFLSCETDMAKHLTALRLGGDDFLTKPISSNHLISSVTARIERARTLRSYMIRDSMTGLYNHSSISEELEKALASAKRKKAFLSFAMIDLDHFKIINDTYGHPAGDRVIRSLAMFFRQRLRTTDLVGRYGGEEFAVVLSGTDAKTALSVINEIRESFSKMVHRAGNSEFNITLSCGIATYPEYGDSKAIVNAADMALYEAKRTGRNRVCILPSCPC